MTNTDLIRELDDADTCPQCDGSGLIYRRRDEWGNWIDDDCRACRGTGALLSDEQYLQLAGVQT